MEMVTLGEYKYSTTSAGSPSVDVDGQMQMLTSSVDNLVWSQVPDGT